MTVSLTSAVPGAAGSGVSRLVVTGPNGTGKSTLLALLAGDLEPDTGSVTRGEGVRVARLAQESPPPSRRRAAEVYAASGADVPAPDELGLLAAESWDRPVAELSIGQQRRLDLALLLAGRPHVLLLDEPTNHLSADLVEELTDALRTTAAAVVLTTHDRQLLRDLADWPRLALPL